MRAFIVLCLVAVACADKLGYNYQPVGHSSSGLSFTPGGAASNAAPSYSSGSSFTPSGSASNFGPSYDGGVGSFQDAANAQRAIQGQYDSLGGPSHSINGGVAPVLNFASQAPAAAAPAASAPGASYLPASIFRH
uniref:Uncharacterized protein n=1 Tax=Musca domestica TaxID=7370 RepID=A0A1I8MA40_MUSDO